MRRSTLLRGEIGHDIYLALFPDSDQLLQAHQPEKILGCFTAKTTANDPRLTLPQRYHYRQRRLRSLFEVFE